ncbi:cytochrome c oxidase assembly protein COX16 homolog, mitochondrial [Sipha flava]|jgi:cytochrome c oxidase assembly protein subunit 16|uniref:Cytochrome c oxidase assembly protein COX16 homolog, mitochondrial n=1 Tax=Sipha flava TaxID=143950 RepID=A0A8B8FF32_9HEMI|nr:cytochrome c oxidase assembly protein COX16 homolog, mitochondrial [Sipha flava]
MNNLLNNKFLRFGVPFALLVVGGSFVLKEFSQIRYDHRKTKFISPDELKKQGIEMKPRGSITIETEYKKLIEQVNLDDYQNKRIQRPPGYED